MQNGDSLYTTLWYNEMSIIPYPGHPNQFVLFLAGITSNANPGLRYCIIDLNQNGGLGKVTQKNILIDPNPICDGMIAIRHGNGRDWWLVYRGNWYNSNSNFNVLLVDSAGINSMAQQTIGSPVVTGFYRLKVNPTADKIAGVSSSGQIELFDFDRCTGTLSNFQSIVNVPVAQVNNTSRFWDLEFSTSGRYLYVITNGTSVYLYQLDLNASSIYNSKQIINFSNTPSECTGYLKRGPDNRIYKATAWYDGVNYPWPYPDTTYNVYNTHLSVVNAPDSLGAACDFQPYSVYLPQCRTYYGLPNNPDYALGPLIGSPCDTLSVGIQERIEALKPFNLFPNPFASSFTIERRAGWNQACEVAVFDVDGKKLVQLHWSYEKRIEIPTLNWRSGIYVIQINMNGKLFNLKGVKM